MKISVIDFLTHTLKLHRDKIAFVDDSSSLTFGELDSKSNVIANEISSLLGGKTQKPIFVYLPKSTLCVTALIAVAKSGNFYTPSDPSFPLEKTESILNVLKPSLIITDSKGKDKLMVLNHKNVEILDLDSLDLSLKIDYNMPKIPDTAPLYCLFTSGSTGVPKGVVVAHRSVIKFIQAMSKEYNITHEDRIANQTPFVFDVSMADIYNTIATGASMYIVKKSLFAYPVKLVEFLNTHKITLIFWVPSALTMVANMDILSRIACPSLQKILFAGEVMPNKILNYWRKYCKNATFANLYGPTEATISCTFYTIDRDFQDFDPLPIGIPLENCGILLLDESSNAVKEGEIGELCINGTCLALGYYGDFEKSKEAFTQNPLNTMYEEKIYRTGDLVRYNEYGELLYCGRKDSQIKHLGYRIELGEIESAAFSLESVCNAAAIYDWQNKKIVLFVSMDTQCKWLESGNLDSQLIKALAQKLAQYMLPSMVINLEAFPLNDNGKINRKELATMYENMITPNTTGGGGVNNPLYSKELSASLPSHILPLRLAA